MVRCETPREWRGAEQAVVAVAAATDRGGVSQAFDRLDRESMMMAEIVDRFAGRLQAVLRDAEPQKGDGRVRGGSSASGLANSLEAVTDRLEQVRVALICLLDRVDL